MGGKHETPSKRGFWISLTASTLKVLVIVGALVAGVLVLARSFENAVQPTGPLPSPSASVATSPKPSKDTPPDTEPDQAGVILGVFNGTDTEGLARDVEKALRSAAGYSVAELGNTTETIKDSTIYYVKTNDKAAAEALANTQADFAEADVLPWDKSTEVIPEGSTSATTIDKSVQVVIFVGENYSGA